MEDVKGSANICIRVRRKGLATPAEAMLQALKTTAGNIRSMRAANPTLPFDAWLEVVEEAIRLARGGV